MAYKNYNDKSTKIVQRSRDGSAKKNGNKGWLVAANVRSIPATFFGYRNEMMGQHQNGVAEDAPLY